MSLFIVPHPEMKEKKNEGTLWRYLPSLQFLTTGPLQQWVIIVIDHRLPR